jgi:hypothetical protein
MNVGVSAIALSPLKKKIAVVASLLETKVSPGKM